MIALLPMVGYEYPCKYIRYLLGWYDMKRGKKGGARPRVDLVIGRNAVTETLRHAARRVSRLLVATEAGSAELDAVVRLAEMERIPIERITRDELTDIAVSGSHQSVGAVLKSRDFASLKPVLARLAEKQTACILALDGVQDPQNLGALLRAAECFGVDAVLWSKNRNVTITPVVTKVSVGASELVPLVPVSNLAQALNQCKEAGFWTAVAAVGEGSQSVQDFDWPDKTVLVLGAEGEGARDRTLREADFSVRIDMRGVIDSLNVSQAGAVLLHFCSLAQAEKNS
jgi:23S rRNA (guanosine2251-2'-O)-methyltransferase